MRTKDLKSSKGITLIALVVTIIVLLILLGTAVASITGRKGVIGQAQDAKSASEIEDIRENITLAYVQAEGKKRTVNEDLSPKIKEELDKDYDSGNTSVSKEDSGEYTVIVNGKTFIINSRDKVLTEEEYAAVGGEDVDPTSSIGKFQTVNGKAYYYTGSNPTAGTEITAENMGDYLGRKVSYTPASTFSDRGKSSTYRIFYIDVGTGTNGKYGDGKGTIYLKADDDGNNKTLDSIDTTNKTDVNVMSTLNPMWNATYSTSGYDNAKYTKYLLDKGIWNGYKDTAGIANYVVGAASLEMWVDSYNAFLSKNTPTSGTYYAHNCTVTQDTTKGLTEENYGYGYYIGYNNVYTDNSGEYTNSNTLVNPSSYSSTDLKDRVCAWNKGSGYYWLASPSAYDCDRVMMVYGEASRVDFTYYDDNPTFCPLVSCNSGVAISEAQ